MSESERRAMGVVCVKLGWLALRLTVLLVLLLPINSLLSSGHKPRVIEGRRHMLVEDNAVAALSEQLFVPPIVGPEIYAGSIIAVLPIIYATVLFTERVNIQRNCAVCKGSGLVFQTTKGNPLKRPRKCLQCGGFLPFISWKYFFFSSFVDPGNGGALLLPRKKKDAPEVVEEGEDDDSSQ